MIAQNKVEIITLVYLVICSYQDIKYKGVSIWLMITGNIWGIIIAISRAVNDELAMEELVIAILPGLVMLLTSIISQLLGMADGLMLIMLGMILQPTMVYAQMIISSLLLLVFALILKIYSKNITQLPYIPFLLIGYICLI